MENHLQKMQRTYNMDIASIGVGCVVLLVIGFLCALGHDIWTIRKEGFDNGNLYYFFWITVFTITVIVALFVANSLGSLVISILSNNKG